MLTEEQREYVEGLRELADWLEAHPEIKSYDDVHLVCNSRADLQAIARAMGRGEKDTLGDTYVTIERHFRGVRVWAACERKLVCESRIVGTRSVPEKVVPAHDEPIVEWDCTPLFAPKLEAEPDPAELAAASTTDDIPF